MLERAGAFYQSLGQGVLASALVNEAARAWRHWGAHAKVEQLEQRVSIARRPRRTAESAGASSAPRRRRWHGRERARSRRDDQSGGRDQRRGRSFVGAARLGGGGERRRNARRTDHGARQGAGGRRGPLGRARRGSRWRAASPSWCTSPLDAERAAVRCGRATGGANAPGARRRRRAHRRALPRPPVDHDQSSARAALRADHPSPAARRRALPREH